MTITLDCTPRDGGYYNDWDFKIDLIEDYLHAVSAVGIDYVEIGLRSLVNSGYKGPNAYSTDEYLRSINIPKDLRLGVMINAVELLGVLSLENALEQLFPEDASTSRIDLVRVACHIDDFEDALPASIWLKKRGFQVGYNLMQIADCKQEKVEELALKATEYDIDVLYFADSLGSMTPDDTVQIIEWLRSSWKGDLGFHTHDNLGLALQNCLRAIENGVTWLDSTITGMGRGPGNVKTEELIIELAAREGKEINLIPLLKLIRNTFKPMQEECGWGTNPYYYLAGKYGIHPTYIQDMLGDSRYSEEDILAVIAHLQHYKSSKKYNNNALDIARNFYQDTPIGTWSPKSTFKGHDVLLLGSGPGAINHQAAIESYKRKYNPIVVALNTQTSIKENLIDFRIACHPIRLLADCSAYKKLKQPLITPLSCLSEVVKKNLEQKVLLDYGLAVKGNTFTFGDKSCQIPSPLVLGYALAMLNSGEARRILLAGFDGYASDDPRAIEIQSLFNAYLRLECSVPITSVTPTKFILPTKSIYFLGAQ